MKLKLMTLTALTLLLGGCADQDVPTSIGESLPLEEQELPLKNGIEDADESLASQETKTLPDLTVIELERSLSIAVSGGREHVIVEGALDYETAAWMGVEYLLNLFDAELDGLYLGMHFMPVHNSGGLTGFWSGYLSTTANLEEAGSHVLANFALDGLTGELLWVHNHFQGIVQSPWDPAVTEEMLPIPADFPNLPHYEEAARTFVSRQLGDSSFNLYADRLGRDSINGEVVWFGVETEGAPRMSVAVQAGTGGVFSFNNNLDWWE